MIKFNKSSKEDLRGFEKAIRENSIKIKEYMNDNPQLFKVKPGSVIFRGKDGDRDIVDVYNEIAGVNNGLNLIVDIMGG